jgi:hypothetical protein
VKILFLGKFYPIQGGEATRAYDLLVKLREFGHDITILTDSRNYKENQLVKKNHDLDNAFLNTLNIIDAINFSNNNESLSDLVFSKLDNTFDVVIGWYLFPYALEAIKISKEWKIPSILQHAGSDIKTLLNSKEKNNIVNELKKADCFLYYPNTKNILENLGFDQLIPNMPTIPTSYINTDENKSNDKYLILGSKNKSKYYKNILNDAENNKIKIDWYGSGSDTFSFFLKGYQSIPCFNIPKLIKNYKALIYIEDDFDIKTHGSRIPYEALLSGKIVFMNYELVEKYKLFSNFIIPISKNENYLDKINKYTCSMDFINKEKELKKFILEKTFSSLIWQENIELIIFNVIKKYKKNKF